MVNIYYDTLTDEIMDVARMIATAQKTTVKITTPTEIVEVHYEEEKAGIQEGNESEKIETR